MTDAALPPGPRSALWTTIDFLRRPMDAMAALAARYGDPISIPSLFGPIVTTGDPAGVREIFGADPDTFVPVSKPDQFEPVLGRGSLFVMEGARHRAARKLLAPPFHGDRMRHYGRLMIETSEARAAAWQVGRPFSLLEELRQSTLDVIVRAVLGVSGDERVARTRAAVIALVHAMNPVTMTFKFLRRRFFGIGPWARALDTRAHVDALLGEEIAARRRGERRGEDILSLLVAARYDDGSALPDAEIVDQLLTLLFGGHETTATSITWALWFLHREENAGSLERLRAEVASAPDDPAALARLPFLEAVCQETLRLRPLIAVVSRKLARPLRLLGRDIPAGLSVAASPALTHFRQDLYPEPEKFVPQRFVDGRSYGPFEYYPFGGGTRRCIGAALGAYQMRVVLGTIVRRARLRLLDEKVRPVLKLAIVGPSTGVRCVAEEPHRLASGAAA